MESRKLVLMSLLIAVGAALYLVIPGFNAGMKPDFMLTMMFIGIFLFPEARNVFLLGVTTGVISGLFSTFPGGFLPNVIDKLITAFVVYAIVVTFKKFASSLISATVIAGLGTILSGSIFLSIAIFILGVNLPFVGLFVTVVLPAVAMNAITFFIVYPIVIQLLKRTSLKSVVTN